MQDFTDMAEAHEWTLRRLREMAGRLTEQAYSRATEAAALRDDEAQVRWMLVFDRMARGLRLSMALEAKLARERRWDARDIEGEVRAEARERGSGPAARADAEPCERELEGDDDGLPESTPLPERIARLKAIIEGAGGSEPPTPLRRPEREALELLRAERARRAARDLAPDEPWDVLGAADLAQPADPAEPPWRGAG